LTERTVGQAETHVLHLFRDPDRKGRVAEEFVCGLVREYADPDAAEVGLIKVRSVLQDPRLGRLWVGRTGRFVVALFVDRCPADAAGRVEREFGIRGEVWSGEGRQ
jgi:hypothetical protein